MFGDAIDALVQLTQSLGYGPTLLLFAVLIIFVLTSLVTQFQKDRITRDVLRVSAIDDAFRRLATLRGTLTDAEYTVARQRIFKQHGIPDNQRTVSEKTYRAQEKKERSTFLRSTLPIPSVAAFVFWLGLYKTGNFNPVALLTLILLVLVPAWLAILIVRRKSPIPQRMHLSSFRWSMLTTFAVWFIFLAVTGLFQLR